MARNGSTSRWRKLRAQVIREEPLCQLRIPGVCTQVSTTADHKIPYTLRPDLEYERANLQGACAECNNKKRAKTMDELPMQKALKWFD